MDGNSTTNFIVAVASTVTATAIVYGISSARRAIKKLSGEHNWLMKTTKDNSETILRLMKIVERRSKIIEKQAKKK